MIESEWMIAAEPKPMLDSLGGEVSDRKLRLFACAYARTGSWLAKFSKLCFSAFYVQWGVQAESIDLGLAQNQLLALRSLPPGGPNSCGFAGRPPRGPLGKRVVRAAERWADGRDPLDEIARLRRMLRKKHSNASLAAAYCGPSADRPTEEYSILRATIEKDARSAALRAIDSVDHYFVAVADSGQRRALNSEFRTPLKNQTLRLQTELLREILGNPFVPRSFEPAWRTPSVKEIARSIYSTRRYSRLPELGESLVATGCTDDELLRHCVSPTEHVRGCWALDLVLGKS